MVSVSGVEQPKVFQAPPPRERTAGKVPKALRLRFFFLGHFTVVGTPESIPRLVPLATVYIVNIETC